MRFDPPFTGEVLPNSTYPLLFKKMSYVTYLYNYNTLPYIYIYDLIYSLEMRWNGNKIFDGDQTLTSILTTWKTLLRKGKLSLALTNLRRLYVSKPMGFKLLGYGIVTVLRISYLTMLNRGVFMGEWGID